MFSYIIISKLQILKRKLKTIKHSILRFEAIFSYMNRFAIELFNVLNIFVSGTILYNFGRK